MSKIRLYQNDELNVGNDLILNSRNFHYLSKVLRIKIGAKIIIFNDNGFNYLAIIKSVNKAAIITILEKSLNQCDSDLNITLIQALVKGDKMDYIVQKATELGINTIIPVITERTIVKLTKNKVNKKQQHWQDIAISSSEQCGRANIPKVESIMCFSDLMQQKIDNGFILSLDTNKTLLDYQYLKYCTILIGPEGGFSNEEMVLAKASNYQELSLGKRVLRTETASIVVLANLRLLWGA